MKVSFLSSFERDLRKIRDQKVLKSVKTSIISIENAKDLLEIRGLKKLKVGVNYYRIRLGDYRLGLIIHEDNVQFVRLLHRSDLYRFFP